MRLRIISAVVLMAAVTVGAGGAGAVAPAVDGCEVVSAAVLQEGHGECFFTYRGGAIAVEGVVAGAAYGGSADALWIMVRLYVGGRPVAYCVGRGACVDSRPALPPGAPTYAACYVSAFLLYSGREWIGAGPYQGTCRATDA